MKGSSSTALTPFLGPSWWAALIQSGANRPVDRALGAAATLGLSIAMVRFMTRVLRSSKKQEMGGETQSLVPLIKGILSTLFVPGEIEKGDGSGVVKHAGSCHCRSIKFELLAPRTLNPSDSSGKIRYPRVRAVASSFRFTKGAEHAHMYYVSSSDHKDDSVVAAYSFCTRCGVHILHAPRSDSNVLEVNVDCLEQQQDSDRVSREDGVNMERTWESYDTFEVLKGKKLRNSTGLREDSKFPEECDVPSQVGGMTPDQVTKLPDPKTDSTDASQGTPSTVNTSMGTDSFVTAMRMRSLALEHDSSGASIESESISAESTGAPDSGASLSSSLPRLTTNLSVESPHSTATPMMRDQLKYYMKKHLKSSSSLISTPENP